MLLLRRKREGVKTLVLTFEGRSRVSLQLQGTQIDSYLDLSPTSDRGGDCDTVEQSEIRGCACGAAVRVRVLCQERGGCRRRRGPPPCPQKSRTGVAEKGSSQGQGLLQ